MERPLLVLESMRPRQWVKNILLLAGLYFPSGPGGGPLLLDAVSGVRALTGFVVFCLLAGSIYLLNDLVDAPRDRLHPRKKHRPIASGRLDTTTAKISLVMMGITGLIIAYQLSFAFGLCASAYVLMEVFYTSLLKQVHLIDTIVISMGFVIRAVSGIIVLRTETQSVLLTPWFVICVLFLSLMLAFCKRRGELVAFEHEAAAYRRVLGLYSEKVLDIGIGICAGATIMTYALYSVEESHRPWNMLTTMPFVIFGVFRYLHLVFDENRGDAPEEVFLHDPPLIGCVILWAMALALVFYPVT